MQKITDPRSQKKRNETQIEIWGEGNNGGLWMSPVDKFCKGGCCMVGRLAGVQKAAENKNPVVPTNPLDAPPSRPFAEDYIPYRDCIPTDLLGPLNSLGCDQNYHPVTP
jgi:hypothetical protein